MWKFSLMNKGYKKSFMMTYVNKYSYRPIYFQIDRTGKWELHSCLNRTDSCAELPGACYRKMPKSVLKKEKCFDFTIESSIDFKKGQMLNKF